MRRFFWKSPPLRQRFFKAGRTAAGLLLPAAMLLSGCRPGGSEPESAVSTAPSTTTSTTAATTAPTTAYVDPETGISYDNSDLIGQTAEKFELPLQGATGFASVAMAVTAAPDGAGGTVVSLVPGDAFTILEEMDGRWWRVTREGEWTGWVDSTYCYLNIPDVIPSIVFDNTNAYSSIFVSSGKDIPGITGEKLYDSKRPNERLGQEQYVVAANSIMVKKIYAAQQAALADGYTLVINETFRPYDVQLEVADKLKALYREDAEVRANIDKSPWGIGWFIASRLSTHQIGCAMDVSLARVTRMEYRLSGEYRYAVVTGYAPCEMPTPMHELSSLAVCLKRAVDSYSPTAWKSVDPADTMTEDALRLQKYCTSAGMSPLASEWWHFNDLEAKQAIGSHYTTEVFYIDDCLSRAPD